MKWIIIIAVVLWWLHQRGKKELARKEAEKRANDQSAEPQIDIVAAAERSERAARRVRELRVQIETVLRQVDPYAIEDDSKDDSEDDEAAADDDVTPAKAEPYAVTPPAAPYVPPPPEPPVVYAAADDTSTAAVNAEVLAAIERASHAAPAHVRKPAHGLNAASTKSRVLVRDSVIMQTLLQRHPGNYIYWRRR